MQQKPYSGNGKPFIYAMYAPEDREAAEVVLSAMQEKGYELWPSERFDKRRFGKAALVLFFLSPAAVVNEAMNRAIHDAVQRDYAMLAIHLCHTELTPAQRLLLNTQQGIMRHECASEEAFYDKLFGSSLMRDLQVTSAQKRAASLTTWGISAGVLFAVVAAVVLALGIGAQVPEDSLLAELGYTGRMADITSIYLYGEQMSEARSDVTIRGKRHNNEQKTFEDVIFINDLQNSVAYDEISDLSDFGQLKNLKELSIAGNHVADISPLFRLHDLEFLDLTGNPIEDITGIGALSNLQTLCIGGTLVSDLSALAACYNLKKVILDAQQYRVFTNDGAQYGFALVPVGPKEELTRLSSHIFGGPEENGGAYSVFIQTRSLSIYNDYTYEVWKDDKQIQIVGSETMSDFGNETMSKTHLFLNQAAFGAYDPSAEYRLIVRYLNWSATFRIWHKYDDASKLAMQGNLLYTEGF